MRMRISQGKSLSGRSWKHGQPFLFWWDVMLNSIVGNEYDFGKRQISLSYIFNTEALRSLRKPAGFLLVEFGIS